jgi:hypothetical protein
MGDIVEFRALRKKIYAREWERPANVKYLEAYFSEWLVVVNTEEEGIGETLLTFIKYEGLGTTQLDLVSYMYGKINSFTVHY